MAGVLLLWSCLAVGLAGKVEFNFTCLLRPIAKAEEPWEPLKKSQVKLAVVVNQLRGSKAPSSKCLLNGDGHYCLQVNILRSGKIKTLQTKKVQKGFLTLKGELISEFPSNSTQFKKYDRITNFLRLLKGRTLIHATLLLILQPCSR